MAQLRTLSTKEKALKLNMRPDIYGSFAEIGAGQEVAANFFKAGGASGTVAKTMSAYDMSFSDAIYGECDRYVTESRLYQMLDKEYELLPERLNERSDRSQFFAFANTVEALNYSKSNRPHGWVGIKFQLSANAEPNYCIIHVKMRDRSNLMQQNCLGVIGVNLIFGCFFIRNADELLDSLMDDLSPDRIEIDMIRISGPDFTEVDNRLMALKLVKKGYTKAAMFGPDGNVLQPSETLYKKNVLVLRGRFRPVSLVNVDMLLKSLKSFKSEPDVDQDNILAITELTLNDLTRGGEIDEEDFLIRADMICSLGRHVMVSNYHEYYRLVEYLTGITRGKKIGIILGIYNLEQVFDEGYYESLKGGILEAFGTLFGNNVRLYVYPSLKKGGDGIYSLDDVNVEPHLKHLLQFLIDNDKIKKIEGANTSNLHIISDDLLEMIEMGIEGWEKYVPKKVELSIKEKGLFGYSSMPSWKKLDQW